LNDASAKQLRSERSLSRIREKLDQGEKNLASEISYAST
jgi:hypothetical protein